MSDDFDPYLKWLGIPPKHQPPDHYRLLGLEPLESDPDVIENAADRQMSHLRTFRNGKRVELAERLLNEVAEAKICLLHPEHKRDYDAKIRAAEAKLHAVPPKSNGHGAALKSAVALAEKPAAPPPARLPAGPSAKPAAAAPPVSAPRTVAAGPQPQPSFASPMRSSSRRHRQTPWIAIAAIGVLAVGGLGLAAMVVPSLLQSTDEISATNDAHEADATATANNVTNPTTTSGTGTQPLPTPQVDNQPTEPPARDLPQVAVDNGGSRDTQPDDGRRGRWRGEGPSPWGGSRWPPRERDPEPSPQPDDSDDVPVVNNSPLPGTEDDPTASPDPTATGEDPAAEVAARRATPTTEQQKAIEARVRDLYSLTPDASAGEQAAAVKKLLADAAGTGDNPDERFVMLRVAAETAAAQGDVTTAMSAVDALAADYELEGAPLRLKLVEQANKAALPPAERGQILRDSLPVIDGALADNQFAEVEALTTTLLASARRLNDRELNTALIERRKSALALRKQYDKALAALDTLKANPDDAAANGVVGGFWAFVKDNWEKGLPHLAKSDDVAQASAAQREMAKRSADDPMPSDDVAKLAGDWLAIGAKQEQPAKLNVLRHAQSLYNEALPEATGLTKTAIERQLAEIEKQLASLGAPGTSTTPVARMARISASCDSAFEMYLNGEHLLSGRREEIGEIDRELKSGDVLLVRGTNMRNERGFAAVIKFEDDGKTIVTGQANAWYVFVPVNPQAWFDPRGVGAVGAASLGDGDRHQRIEQQTDVRSQSIWGNNQFLSYFVLRIP